MKTRNGFVSNSSTSSFLIYGVCVEKTYDENSKADIQLEEIYKANPDLYKTQIEEYLAKLKAKSKANKNSYAQNVFNKLKCLLKICSDEILTDEDRENINDRLGGEETLDELGNLFGFEAYYPYDDVYVGISWSDIKDNETGAQFKQRIESLMKVIMGKDIECSTYSHAWRDG